jgi:hypothetical protein
MEEAIRLGGWGMYPTLLFGLVLLVATAVQARRQTPDGQRVVANLRLLVLLSSALGFTAGAVRTLTTVPHDRCDLLGVHALVGIGESLVNVGAGLVILVLATIVATVGAWLGGKRGAELVAPHS